MTAKGQPNLDLEAKVHHNSSVRHINPSKIGTIQTDYQPRYIITGDRKDDGDNMCRADLSITRGPRHFMIQPITRLDIGNKKLLIPLYISHTVKNVKNSGNDVDFNNRTKFTETKRYAFTSISDD